MYTLLLTLSLATASPAEAGTLPAQMESATTQTVSFTLRNGFTQSIKLRIPGVMNPNLSPMSNSGVNLQVGQEIFFYMGSKKKLLLTVSEEMQGQTLLVNKLIKEREAEIRAEKKKD